MDPRLLMAIDNVIGDGDLFTLDHSGVSAAEVGSHTRQALYDAAASKDASNGTPIPELRGVAAESATKSRIGGGAKYAGGGGIERGEKALNQTELKAQLLVLGIKTAAVIAQITIEYAVLVRRDRKLARESSASAPQALSSHTQPEV